jgi:putative SOS response-associated peptidase YedK
VDTEPGIVSCAILTTEPNTLLADIHDRMPVIIPAEKYRTWLDPRTSLPAVAALTQPYPSEEMDAWRISLMVNDPKVDSEEILRHET